MNKYTKPEESLVRVNTTSSFSRDRIKLPKMKDSGGSNSEEGLQVLKKKLETIPEPDVLRISDDDG